MTNPLSAILAANDGAKIDGGCDHCDAYQIIHAHHYGRDFHRIAVYHEEDCPLLAAMEDDDGGKDPVFLTGPAW